MEHYGKSADLKVYRLCFSHRTGKKHGSHSADAQDTDRTETRQRLEEERGVEEGRRRSGRERALELTSMLKVKKTKVKRIGRNVMFGVQKNTQLKTDQKSRA